MSDFFTNESLEIFFDHVYDNRHLTVNFYKALNSALHCYNFECFDKEQQGKGQGLGQGNGQGKGNGMGQGKGLGRGKGKCKRYAHCCQLTGWLAFRFFFEGVAAHDFLGEFLSTQKRRVHAFLNIAEQFYFPQTWKSCDLFTNITGFAVDLLTFFDVLPAWASTAHSVFRVHNCSVMKKNPHVEALFCKYLPFMCQSKGGDCCTKVDCNAKKVETVHVDAKV